MKSLSKKLLVALLSVGMVVTMIPFTAFPVEAATNLDGGFEGQDSDVFTALGFDTSELPEDYDPDTADNPYGRDTITGNQVFELAVAGGSGSTVYGDGDNEVQGTGISGTPGGTGVGMDMSAAAAGDFDGDGLPGEIVYVGYGSGIKKPAYNSSTDTITSDVELADLDLQIYNGKTKTYGSMKRVGGVNAYYTAGPKKKSIAKDPASVASQREENWLNLLQVTAGDYDGDGISEIAVYVGENGSPRVDIYKYQKTSTSSEGDWIDMDNWKRVWSHALSGACVPNMVSLVSGDFNRDGIDDLGISYGITTFELESVMLSPGYMEASRAVMLWGDRSNMLQTSSPIDLAEGDLGEQTRVSLIKGDLNQDGTPELIATGHPMANIIQGDEFVNLKINNNFYQVVLYSRGNAQRTAISYLYDQENGLTVDSSNLLEPVKGKFETSGSGDTEMTAWTSENGFDYAYYSSPYMRTNATVFQPQGAEYPYLYLDSCLYQAVEGQLSLTGKMEEKYDGENSFNLGNKKWGYKDRSEQGYYVEYGADAQDINGKGYDILVTNSMNTTGPYGGNICTQYAVVNGTEDGKMEATITAPYVDADEQSTVYKASTGTFLDCDVDTVIKEYTGEHYLKYSDPKVLAIIAAAPYFEDVDEATGYEFAGNNTTSWGQTHGHSDSNSISVDFSFDAWGNHELQEAAFNYGFEWSAGFTLSYEDTTTTSFEYTMTFGTYGDQDAVAFYSVPTEYYIYRIKTPDGKGGYTVKEDPVTRAHQPVFQVLTLDYYEEIQKNYDELPALAGKAITSTPGDPASYPSSDKGYQVIAEWDQEPAGVGYGNGSIEQEISISRETEKAYSLGAEVEFKFGGGAKLQLDAGQSGFESTGGFQFSLNPAGGWAHTDMKGTTIAAEVANMPVEFQPYGYYFNWKLFSYYYEISSGKEKKLDEDDDKFSLKDDIKIGAATSARVPVISYIVNDVEKPPVLPDNFQQDYDRTTSDSNVMTWTYDDKATAFIIYKYFDFPVGGGLQEVDRILPGDSDHYRLKYDEDGNPYKEYFFVDSNLSPYTEYEYAIQVERLEKVPPLSTPSALTPARTKAANGYPKITIAESDDEQDGTLLVYPDKNAYLTAAVTGPEGENIGNYYSVVQYQWQKKNKGAWEDLVGETNKTLTFVSPGVDAAGDYRCQVNVITKADNTAITAYSDGATLTHAKRTSFIKDVSVTDVSGGGLQLFAEVGNAHKDSASIPGGVVTFNLTSNVTGQTYQYNVQLSAAGTATAVLDQILPEGMYTVQAYYSGSYIFKSCSGKTLYLSQRATGYDIDLPGAVTYGDEADITFRTVTKTNGITSTENTNANGIEMYRAAPMSRAKLSGAAEHTGTTAVTAGQKYWHKDDDGVVWYFTAPVSGTPTFDWVNSYVRFGSDMNENIEKVTGLNSAGKYLLKAGTPAGVYLISMKAPDEQEYAYATIEVLPRSVTLQIPRDLKAGESDQEAEDIKFADMTLLNGSWADCDITDDAFKYAGTSIDPVYYNTAGKVFDADSVRALCGAYSVIGTKELPNYSIIWRTGQLTVLGAANEVRVGARPFDGLDVGTVYMMAPEIGSSRGLNDLTKQIQAGVRMVFSAQPDEGYEVYDWYINGVAQGSKSNMLVYTMLAEEVDIEVQFAIKQTTLSFGTAGDENGGTLTCSDASLTSGSIVRRNAAFTFTAEAAEGYHFKEWRYTEQGLGTIYNDEDSGKAESTFDFVMPGTSCSLYAVFERDGYVFNYIDGNNAKGLTATYENEEGKTVTAKPGGTVKGGTEITVAPAAGYVLDKSRQYVSQGTQGKADPEKGTYTLKIDQDTTVYGWTRQQVYDVTLAFDYEADPKAAIDPDAVIRYIIGENEYSFAYDPSELSKVIENIPGGTPVTVDVEYPGWVDLKGWTANATTVETTQTVDLMAASVKDGETVEKNKSYFISDNGALYYFTAPVNGTVGWDSDSKKVTVYSSSVRYTIPALKEAETLTVHLTEKDIHQVSLADISEYGEYVIDENSLPEGAFVNDSMTVVSVHDMDDLTLRVKPYQGKTVSYWQTSWMEEDTWKSVKSTATSLRYTIPSIDRDYSFEPIFSTTTYNIVSWPTIGERLNGLTLNPESGYIANVAAGNDFKFTLSGGALDLVDKVRANGHEFTAEGNVVGETTFKVENGIYSITKLTENQEITVDLKPIGVTVNGVDINAMSGVGWTYDSGTQTLTLNRSGLNLSGTNDQDLAPDLKIVTTEMVGSLTLESLKVTSASSETLLSLAADTIITANGNSILKNSVKARSVYAAQDLTFRGNGSLEVEGFSNASAPTVETDRNLTLLGTMELIIKSNRSVGKTNIGLVTHDLTIGADGIETVSPVLRVSADSNSKSGYAVSADNVTIYGGEASFTGTNEETYGLIFQGNVDCYGGILEVSSPSKRALWKAGDGEVRAFYPDGYMCRYAVTNQQGMFDEDEPQVTYTSYAKLAAAYDNGKYDIVEGTDIDFKKQIYVRLSPMSGSANGDNLTLSVEYNGKTYSRSVKEDTDGSGYYYYIDVSDNTGSTEPKELKALRHQDSYTVFNDSDHTGHIDIEENDIIVAENDVAQGSNLYFNIMKFERGEELEGNSGYRYTVVWPADNNNVGPLDYTISGSVSGDVNQTSRGSINANGAIGFTQTPDDYSRLTEDVRSLTLDGLTHVNMSVGKYPVYLKGDNYLIGSSVNTVPLSVPVGDVDLRSDGNGTLTISTASGTYGKALGLQNGHLKLTDVASLTLISDRGALSSLGVTYKHGEGDAAVALPYGLGWLEDVGDKAGNAVTQNEVVSLTDTQQYVRIYTTSTDAKATQKKLVYDKSTPESTPTVSKVTLTPPIVMGVPHLFTPGEKDCRAELYKGNEKVTELTEDTDYTYTERESKIIGDLAMKYDSADLKNLAVGEYTIRVFFQDENTTDATYYSLDIPLEVRDTAHVVGELIVVDPDTSAITLTRGNSKNITTKFTGTTPKTYDWSIAAVGAGGATKGISLTDDTHGAANTVSVDANAGNGAYKITVKSYADEAKQQKLGEVAVDLNVVPKAKSIAVSCEGETRSGDESYMLNHNTLDGSTKEPWDFNAAVTMDDRRSDADPAKVSWSLWGGTMTGTAVDGDGKLTINPNETGLMNSGYLLLTATYTNEDGTKLAKSIKIRLSEDAIVGYTPGTAETGGTINAAKVTNPKGTPIPKNTTVTFSATPATDYKVDTWYINGQPVEEGVDGNTMTFTTEKMGRYSVWATFAKEKNCVVTYEKTGAGTITAESENGTLASGDKVAGGTEVTFTAVPDSFHKVSAWYVDGEKQEREPTETLTLPKINKDVNVKVEFTVPDRTITITAGEHGSITFLVDGVILADPVTGDNGKYTLRVPANRTVTALAVPEENYSVDQWSNLESATAADAICTIPRGMEDAKATVSFKGQVQHKVTVYTNSFENGAGIVEVGSDIVPMSGSKTFPVAEGGSLVLTAVPDAGSTLNDWTVEPESYKDYTIDGNMLTLTNVTEDVEAKATFHRSSNELTLVKEGEGEGTLKADYNLTLGTQVVQNGTLEANGNETIRSGATVVVTVTPADGQIPSTFTVNGEDKSAELVKDPNEVKYTYQIGALTEDTEIKAVFEEMVRYDVTGHADYTVEETVEPADPENPEAVPTTTEKTIGTVAITEFGAGNGFNEVTGADPQKVSVIPNTPVEITFIPADGYLVNTEALSAGVAELLPENSNIRFSFKQSATGTILVLEGIDADLDLSQLDNPFKPKDPEVDFVKLQLINNNTDYGTLTAKTANDDTAPIQYVPGEQIEIPAGTQLTYKAEPKEHFKASVTVNGAVSDEENSLTVNEDTVIRADFEQSKYKVTITTLGKGTGSVTINNKAYEPAEYWLEAGRELSIAAVAAKGSGVSSFTVDGTAVTEGSETVTLDKDIAVIAAFSDTMRAVTYNSPANGKLQLLDAEGKTVESGTSVSIGSKLYVVKTPDAHYTLKTLTVGGTELSGDYFVVDEDRGNDVFCEFTRAEDKVTWIAVYGTVDAQLMPAGDPIGNGEYVPSGSQIKFRVTPKNSNYSLESLTVNGKAMSADSYYKADQEDVEAVAICEYTGDVPGVKEGVKVSMLPVNCTMTAQLEDGTAVKNGDYVKTGDKIKFTHKPTKSDYTLDKFTVIGAEADKNGMYVAGSEDIVASAVYNAPSTTIINDPGVPLAPDATYTVLIDSGDGGTVDVTIKGEPVKSGAEVDLGSKLTIKATPDVGKQLASLTVNGVKFNNGEEYVVYANTLIKAEFEEATTETGLPCYKDEKGNTVFAGFSYDLNGDGVYTEDEYIIPKGAELHFQENHKYFEDMPGNWADEYIQFVGDREIFQGVTDTLFDPEGKVTRAMYVTVIGRLYERSFGTINGGTAQNFTDCDYDSWYGKYVDWAAATGVVNGYDATTFGPNDNVTREQMAAILTRFAKLMKLDTKAGGSLSFTDMDTISDYAVDSVRYCVDKGIITGYEDGRFAPQDNATRAQIAAVIVRYIESVLSE